MDFVALAMTGVIFLVFYGFIAFCDNIIKE